MTALAAMQEDWVRNWDQKMLTGILLWDLSAAYDTLNPSLLCEKLRVYGFDRLSCQWFESFLKGRKQSVRIGKSISRQRNLESGVPQGGILSPIIFTIFGADLEDWTKSSTIFSYADDTSSSSSGESVEEVKRKLEQDAEEVLKFMASNGLVANPSKTTLLMMNKKDEEIVRIKVGESYIEQESVAKLLGILVDDEMGWKEQVNGKGGVISALNQRTYLIKRLRNHINPERLRKVVDSIWTSKLRYGLQLWATVRTENSDAVKKLVSEVQKAQNRLLRILERKRISDKVPIREMLDNQNMLSVNQLAAQIKLAEVWKARNGENYPVKMEFRTVNENGTSTRGATNGKAVETGKTQKSRATFIGDATRLWNKAPKSILRAETLMKAKREIKKYCKTLPV